MLFRLVIFLLSFFCISMVESETINHPINSIKEATLRDGHTLQHKSADQLTPLQGRNHSLILGKRQYGDRLLHIDVAKKSSKIFRIVETDIRFPEYGTKNNKTINYLQVIDRKADGNNGWPYLTVGGIGAKNVTIHFKSQRSYGIDFLVNIFGYNN